MQGQTLQDDAPPPLPDALPDGVASEPPFILWLVLWIGAFSAVTWGMMALFRAVRGRDEG